MTIRKSISILAVAALLGGCGSGQHTSDSSSASQDSAASQQADSNDTTGQGLSKADELSQVDTGATALKVYGNPDKWSGTYVKFPCKISNVVDAGDGGKEANATCGESVTLDFTKGSSDTPDVDYSDPEAVSKLEARQQREMSAEMKKASDSALLLLVGDKVAAFDGGQLVTIIGKVTGTTEGENTMGATTQFPTVRVDYAE
jgi:hypothetical protein